MDKHELGRFLRIHRERLSPQTVGLPAGWPDHAQVGPITLTCDILLVPERDQHVVLFTAEPGTPAHEALELLSVVGLQQLSSTRPGEVERDVRVVRGSWSRCSPASTNVRTSANTTSSTVRT